MGDVCADGRFDLIERFKRDLVEATNIETSPEEMAVLDSILFRMWQMGWLDRLEQPPASPWHRVELEEPTKAGWYLVMDVDGDFNVDEWHNTFGWQFVTPSDADRITHWMPIEPPKEDA